MPDSNPSSRGPQRNRMTYSLGALMLLMLMCSILSALLAGIIRYGDGQQYMYVLASVAAPVGVMIGLSLFVHARRQSTRHMPSKENKADSPND